MSNNRAAFIKLFVKKIKCALGLGQSFSFDGVGIQVISFPTHPKVFIILSPVFYSPQDDHSTFSTGALMKTKLFKSVAEHRHSSVDFVAHSNKKISIPVVTKDSIDYIYLRVHKLGESYSQAHQPNHIQLAPPKCNSITHLVVALTPQIRS